MDFAFIIQIFKISAPTYYYMPATDVKKQTICLHHLLGHSKPVVKFGEYYNPCDGCAIDEFNSHCPRYIDVTINVVNIKPPAETPQEYKPVIEIQQEPA